MHSLKQQELSPVKTWHSVRRETARLVRLLLEGVMLMTV